MEKRKLSPWRKELIPLWTALITGLCTIAATVITALLR